MKQENTCERCVWFDPIDDEEMMGLCRVRPPDGDREFASRMRRTGVVAGYWLAVKTSDWCGKWWGRPSAGDGPSVEEQPEDAEITV